MQSHLPRMHEFFELDIKCLFVNVSLKRLKRSSHFIIHLFSFRLNIGAKQSNWSSMSRIMLCRASKPLKSVALFRFSKCLDRLDFVAVCSPDYPRLFRMVPSLTSYSRPNACLLGAFGLLNFAMISHRWASVKWAASSFICFPL